MKKQNQKGFTLIELIVVIAVIAILAGIAVVQFGSIHEETKSTVTKANARTVVSTIQGCMATYGQDDWYVPRSSGNSYDYSDSSMNNYLEMIFEGGVETENSFSYINQYSQSTSILNWSSPLSAVTGPAIFLTNNSSYSYDNSTVSNMRYLKGTIIIYFATQGSGDSLTTTQIEVYYTDGDGVKCDEPFIVK